MKNSSLRQLKTFVTVARHLSFSRAAQELYLSQPAVSEQVKQLETQVGLPLFEKLGKKIFLTTAGQQMLQHSLAIIEQFNQANEAMQRLRQPEGSKLRVGMITAGSYLFPHVLAVFMQRHQNIELEVAVHNRQELLRCLDDNSTDVALLVGAPNNPLLSSQIFAPHAFVLIASPDHPLAGKRSIPVTALSQERHLVRERGSDTWHAMNEHFLSQLGTLPPPLEIRSTEAIKQAVIAGLGISFVSAYTIKAELQAGQLVVLDVKGFPVQENWQVVHRADKQLAPAAVAFKQFLIDEGSQQIADLVQAEQ